VRERHGVLRGRAGRKLTVVTGQLNLGQGNLLLEGISWETGKLIYRLRHYISVSTGELGSCNPKEQFA